MYYLLSLTVPKPTSDSLKSIFSRVLLNPKMIDRTHVNVDNNFKMGQDFDETFGVGMFECVAPELMNLPVGAEVDVCFKRMQRVTE